MTNIANEDFLNNSNAFLKANYSTASRLGGVCGNRKQNAP